MRNPISLVATCWLFCLLGCAAQRQAPSAEGRCSGDFERKPFDDYDRNQADRDVPTAAPPANVVGALCDGSITPRLLLSIDHGAGTIAYLDYVFEYGGPFVLLDGNCHYYAAYYDRPGITEGNLDAETLDQLTHDLALGELPTFASNKDACADHYADTLIATQDDSVRCRCGECGSDTRATAAMQQVEVWMRRLAAEGKPIMGGVSASASAQFEQDETVDRELEPWPLEAPVHTIPLLLDPFAFVDGRDGASFTGKDAAALRHMRDARAPKKLGDSDYVSPLIYTEDCGQLYAIVVRDELPLSIDLMLSRFLYSAWSKPHIESCVTLSSAPASVSPCPD
jgi:hypothetical protein